MEKSKSASLPKGKIIVLDSSKIGIRVMHNYRIYEVMPIEKRPKNEQITKTKVQKEYRPAPSINHPWKIVIKRPKPYHGEGDRVSTLKYFNYS